MGLASSASAKRMQCCEYECGACRLHAAAHVQMHVSVEHRGAARGSGRAGSMTGGCSHKRKTLSEQKKAEVPVKSAAAGKARAYAHKAKGIGWISEQMLRT